MPFIDWGGQPIWVGLIRGVVGAIIAGLLAYFIAKGVGNSEEMARNIGAVAVLTPLGALFTYGVYDQSRANNNIVISGDVPEAAEGISVRKKAGV